MTTSNRVAAAAAAAAAPPHLRFARVSYVAVAGDDVSAHKMRGILNTPENLLDEATSILLHIRVWSGYTALCDEPHDS